MKLNYSPLTAAAAGALRAEMARKRVSQAALAKQVGCSQQRISRRLSGKHPITVDDLEKFAEALGITVADVLADAAPDRLAA